MYTTDLYTCMHIHIINNNKCGDIISLQRLYPLPKLLEEENIFFNRVSCKN